MRHAERLEQLGRDAGRKEKAARDREADRDKQAPQVHKHTDKARQAARRADAGWEKLAQALREAAATATGARCARAAPGGSSVLERADPDAIPPAAQTGGARHVLAAYLDAPESLAADMLARARRDAQAIADRQEQAAARLGKLLEESATCERQLHSARAEEGRLSAEVQAAADRVAAADLTVAERMRLLLDAYRSYLAILAELRVADPDELIADLESWGVTGEGANPAVTIMDDAARAAGAELGRLAGELGTQRAGHVTRADELAEEIGRLRAGGHDAPPVPHTRAPGARDDRPGAPLWKVTDFAPGLPRDERAGLEAALEAAGILDAWVTPDGNLVDGDVIVVSGLAPVARASCGSVLVPAIDVADLRAASLGEEPVASVLSAIGLGPGSVGSGTWVTTDGRWSNGVLSGTWRKDSGRLHRRGGAGGRAAGADRAAGA